MKPKYKHAKKPRKGKPPAKVVYFTMTCGGRHDRVLRPGFSVTV